MVMKRGRQIRRGCLALRPGTPASRAEWVRRQALAVCSPPSDSTRPRTNQVSTSRLLKKSRPQGLPVIPWIGGHRGDLACTVTPHIAVNGVVSKRGVVRRTAVDGHTTRHAGYAVSQRVRKRIEEVFGWIKAQAGFAKVKVRGCAKAEAVFTFAVAAYNLIRIPKLLAQAST